MEASSICVVVVLILVAYLSVALWQLCGAQVVLLCVFPSSHGGLGTQTLQSALSSEHEAALHTKGQGGGEEGRSEWVD